MQMIDGFSKLTKTEKVSWIVDQLPNDSNTLSMSDFSRYWHNNDDVQKIFDEFSENTISNFYLPYGVAPNFKINDEIFTIPLAIEESSVVAAAAKAAKFWLNRGGFKAEVIGTVKNGHVHFLWSGNPTYLKENFELHKERLLNCVQELVANMSKRGGGLISLDLVDKSNSLENYYQLSARFETCDAMGANFINSVLERLGEELKTIFENESSQLEIIMCILSNYTPECLVKAWVNCPVSQLAAVGKNIDANIFAHKFVKAVQISKVDMGRAVTHNKGIFNGIDALVLATGNDFRAIEACGHAYAARSGTYQGLSDCKIVDGEFMFELSLPLAIGTVGGLTTLHPLAKATMHILGMPDAKKLMQMIVTVGLAQNFAALTSLVTTGIQKGHMKMHLLNILNQFGASEIETKNAIEYFKNNTVSHRAVRDFLFGKSQIQ